MHKLSSDPTWSYIHVCLLKKVSERERKSMHACVQSSLALLLTKPRAVAVLKKQLRYAVFVLAQLSLC